MQFQQLRSAGLPLALLYIADYSFEHFADGPLIAIEDAFEQFVKMLNENRHQLFLDAAAAPGNVDAVDASIGTVRPPFDVSPLFEEVQDPRHVVAILQHPVAQLGLAHPLLDPKPRQDTELLRRDVVSRPLEPSPQQCHTLGLYTVDPV